MAVPFSFRVVVVALRVVAVIVVVPVVAVAARVNFIQHGAQNLAPGVPDDAASCPRVPFAIGIFASPCLALMTASKHADRDD